jgi:hypothetical protein
VRLSLDLADYSHPVLDRPLATKHAWRTAIEQAASGTVRGGTKLTMSAELMAETVRTIVELRNPHLDTEGLRLEVEAHAQPTIASATHYAREIVGSRDRSRHGREITSRYVPIADSESSHAPSSRRKRSAPERLLQQPNDDHHIHDVPADAID